MEQNMVLKLMRVREGAIIPKQATAGSAGYDLCACMDAPQTIEPGERCVFPSGLAAEIPAGTAGRLPLAPAKRQRYAPAERPHRKNGSLRPQYISG